VVRVTIKDPEQIVSFLAEEDTVLRLVAGCSVSPANVGELLAAADIYERGIGARVMSDLMEFDKALQREGAAFIHKAIRLARAEGQPLRPAFQVIDEVTQREAFERQGCEVAIIDLAGHTILASGALDIPILGQVRIQDGQALTERTVTYVLPRGWQVRRRQVAG
jgi:hypothetical protein